MKSLFLSLLLIFQSIPVTYAQAAPNTYNSSGIPQTKTFKTYNGLLSRIDPAVLHDTRKINPNYLSLDPERTNVTLRAAANIRVTFLKEGAGFKNWFGYFTYTGNTPPSNPTLSPIFPNVSQGSGLLQYGDTVLLGQFPAGTKIGFAIVADGFNNSNNGGYLAAKPKFYSIRTLNPKAPKTVYGSGAYSNLKIDTKDIRVQRIAYFWDAVEQVGVIGFDDQLGDPGDYDFDDVVFTISSDPAAAIIPPDDVPITTVSGVLCHLENNGNYTSISYSTESARDTLYASHTGEGHEDDIKNMATCPAKKTNICHIPGGQDASAAKIISVGNPALANGHEANAHGGDFAIDLNSQSDIDRCFSALCRESDGTTFKRCCNIKINSTNYSESVETLTSGADPHYAGQTCDPQPSPAPTATAAPVVTPSPEVTIPTPTPTPEIVYPAAVCHAEPVTPPEHPTYTKTSGNADHAAHILNGQDVLPDEAGNCPAHIETTYTICHVTARDPLTNNITNSVEQVITQAEYATHFSSSANHEFTDIEKPLSGDCPVYTPEEQINICRYDTPEFTEPVSAPVYKVGTIITGPESLLTEERLALGDFKITNDLNGNACTNVCVAGCDIVNPTPVTPVPVVTPATPNTEGYSCETSYPGDSCCVSVNDSGTPSWRQCCQSPSGETIGTYTADPHYSESMCGANPDVTPGTPDSQYSCEQKHPGDLCCLNVNNQNETTWKECCSSPTGEILTVGTDPRNSEKSCGNSITPTPSTPTPETTPGTPTPPKPSPSLCDGSSKCCNPLTGQDIKCCNPSDGSRITDTDSCRMLPLEKIQDPPKDQFDPFSYVFGMVSSSMSASIGSSYGVFACAKNKVPGTHTASAWALYITMTAYVLAEFYLTIRSVGLIAAGLNRFLLVGIETLVGKSLSSELSGKMVGFFAPLLPGSSTAAILAGASSAVMSSILGLLISKAVQWLSAEGGIMNFGNRYKDDAELKELKEKMGNDQLAGYNMQIKMLNIQIQAAQEKLVFYDIVNVGLMIAAGIALLEATTLIGNATELEVCTLPSLYGYARDGDKPKPAGGPKKCPTGQCTDPVDRIRLQAKFRAAVNIEREDTGRNNPDDSNPHNDVLRKVFSEVGIENKKMPYTSNNKLTNGESKLPTFRELDSSVSRSDVVVNGVKFTSAEVEMMYDSWRIGDSITYPGNAGNAYNGQNNPKLANVKSNEAAGEYIYGSNKSEWKDATAALTTYYRNNPGSTGPTDTDYKTDPNLKSAGDYFAKAEGYATNAATNYTFSQKMSIVANDAEKNISVAMSAKTEKNSASTNVGYQHNDEGDKFRGEGGDNNKRGYAEGALLSGYNKIDYTSSEATNANNYHQIAAANRAGWKTDDRSLDPDSFFGLVNTNEQKLVDDVNKKSDELNAITQGSKVGSFLSEAEFPEFYAKINILQNTLCVDVTEGFQSKECRIKLQEKFDQNQINDSLPSDKKLTEKELKELKRLLDISRTSAFMNFKNKLFSFNAFAATEKEKAETAEEQRKIVVTEGMGTTVASSLAGFFVAQGVINPLVNAMMLGPISRTVLIGMIEGAFLKMTYDVDKSVKEETWGLEARCHQIERIRDAVRKNLENQGAVVQNGANQDEEFKCMSGDVRAPIHVNNKKRDTFENFFFKITKLLGLLPEAVSAVNDTKLDSNGLPQLSMCWTVGKNQELDVNCECQKTNSCKKVSNDASFKSSDAWKKLKLKSPEQAQRVEKLMDKFANLTNLYFKGDTDPEKINKLRSDIMKEKAFAENFKKQMLTDFKNSKDVPQKDKATILNLEKSKTEKIASIVKKIDAEEAKNPGIWESIKSFVRSNGAVNNQTSPAVASNPNESMKLLQKTFTNDAADTTASAQNSETKTAVNKSVKPVQNPNANQEYEIETIHKENGRSIFKIITNRYFRFFNEK